MENYIYLMKFQNLERLKEIQCGNIYMKNLEYFTKLEEKEREKFRADRIFVETEVEDHFRVDIGDVSDITYIELADKVLGTDYKV